MLASIAGVPTFLASADTLDLDLVSFGLGTGSFTFDGTSFDLTPSGNYTVDTSAGGTQTITVADNTASAFKIQEGSNTYLGITTSDSTEAMQFGYTAGPTYAFPGGIATFTSAADFNAGMTIASSQSITGEGTLTILSGSGGNLNLEADGDQNVVIKLGDAAGANSLIINDSASGQQFEFTSDGDLTIGRNAVIEGNLTVQGTTTTVESETVKLADNHLYLNDGYTTAAAQAGGLIINYLPTATVDTVAATGFVAGTASTVDPQVSTTAAGPVFVDGDIIQISGANNETNNGLFEVFSHATNVLKIRGIGANANNQGFFQNDFVTDTTVAGNITKVNVSVLQAGTDGAWGYTSGSSTTGWTFTSAARTLQEAYDNGQTITTDGTGGDLTVNGDQDFIVGGSVDVSYTTSGTINQSGTGQVTFSGNVDAVLGLDVTNAALTADDERRSDG
jgi:hypothetical protein